VGNTFERDRFMYTQEFDIQRLRSILAERRISHTAFAAACGLNRSFVSRVLCGYRPGELARIKIARGLHALRLDGEVMPHAS
jgi:transcriptional regulator with XRE-family HTH domain